MFLKIYYFAVLIFILNQANCAPVPNDTEASTSDALSANLEPVLSKANGENLTENVNLIELNGLQSTEPQLDISKINETKTDELEVITVNSTEKNSEITDDSKITETKINEFELITVTEQNVVILNSSEAIETKTGELDVMTVNFIEHNVEISNNSQSQVSETKKEGLELIIVHNNDIHGRFDQTDKFSERCTKDMAAANQCYGGFARTAHVIRHLKNLTKDSDAPAVLYLYAGDIFTGTVWFSLFKHEISSKLMNVLKPDVATLGNHEFDLGVKKLINYLKAIEFPVVVSNLDLSKTPDLEAVSTLSKSKILEVNGIKIGIVGYLTPDTMFQSQTGKVWIEPEIEAVNKETEKLKEAGVSIIIGLGHSGFEMDKEVAEKCPDIDLIIGGHTNTFLYNGPSPDNDEPVAEYPVVIKQPSGKEVPVVQAYAYTKYLGYLEVKFDSDGNLVTWKGNPILLNASIPQDEDVLRELDAYRPKVDELDEIVGQTSTHLNGSIPDCRAGECNLGSLIADSYLFVGREGAKELGFNSSNPFLSFVQAGGIKNSISVGNISVQNILNVLPYNNTLSLLNVNGQIIKNAIEHSAAFYGEVENGGYLQFGGIKVKYNMAKPKGERIASVDVFCAECQPTPYKPLELDQIYPVVMAKFLLKGGDEYKWSDSEDPLKSSLDLNYTDYTSLKRFITEMAIIDQKEDGRQIYL